MPIVGATVVCFFALRAFAFSNGVCNSGATEDSSGNSRISLILMILSYTIKHTVDKVAEQNLGIHIPVDHI